MLAITKVDLPVKTLAFLLSTNSWRIIYCIYSFNVWEQRPLHLQLTLRIVKFELKLEVDKKKLHWKRVCHNIFITYAVRFRNSLSEFSNEDKLISGSPSIKWTDIILIEGNDNSKSLAHRIYHNSDFFFFSQNPNEIKYVELRHRICERALFLWKKKNKKKTCI